MTQKELIQKLIEHYQFGIDNLPIKDLDYFDFLLKNNLECGICSCANLLFDTDIYRSEWINELTNGKGIICGYPVRSKNRTECIELLQIRLDALKSIDLNTVEL